MHAEHLCSNGFIYCVLTEVMKDPYLAIGMIVFEGKPIMVQFGCQINYMCIPQKCLKAFIGNLLIMQCGVRVMFFFHFIDSLV